MIRKLPKIMALLLALIMVVAMVSACNKTANTSTNTPPAEEDTFTPFVPPVATAAPAENEAAVEESAEPVDPALAEFLRDWGADPVIPRNATKTSAADPNTPLVSAYGNFSQKFSPFFSQSQYDTDVANMTQIGTMVLDRAGGIVMNGIQGETRKYNGVDYTYYGTSNLYVNYDADADITTYRARIRQDLKFSDGVPVTIDDLIFTYYVLLDPSYTGSSSLFSYDIVGLKNYRTQLSDEALAKYQPIVEGILAAGADHTWSSSDAWTEQQQTDFWAAYKTEWENACGQIVDYVINSYLSYAPDYMGYTEEEVTASEGMKAAFGMLMWGFGDMDADADGNNVFVASNSGQSWTLKDDDFPTLESYANECSIAYEGDIDAFWETEDPASSGVVLSTNVVNTVMQQLAAADGASNGVPNIAGIRKLNDYAVEILVKGYSAPAIYSILSQYIAPMHYYGDASMYDYENNKFGFTFGDLSIVDSKTTQPLGAGAYKFVKYDNKTVYFEANPTYFQGEPLTKYLQFKEAPNSEVISGIVAGTHDQGNMNGSVTDLKAIKDSNSNNEVVGDIITTSMVDNSGYGYLGINSYNTAVNNERGSDASKSLRKALATILAVFRDTSVNSYYGELANPIQYPITNTNWAAPQPTDDGYEIAYSKDASGNAIFASGMSAEEKYAAAKQAALGFFEAAGYTVENGKVVKGPADVRPTKRGDMNYLEFEVYIIGGGTGDHPAFALLTDAAAAFKEIGITLTIQDLSDGDIMWTAMDAELLDMWVAAWQVNSPDPDMYQTYYGANIIGAGGSDSNKYGVTDTKLDELIMTGRMSDDQSYRKTIYKQALEVVLDWAVEVPLYQRKNFEIFSSERVNVDTLTPTITTMWSWGSDIQTVEMK